MKLDSQLKITTKKCSPEQLHRAQVFLDSEVIRTCSPYVPHDSGILEGSAENATVPGSGVVTWDTPYAAKQYYMKRSCKDLRGPYWFDRAKADHADDWKDGVQKILGGENGSNY